MIEQAPVQANDTTTPSIESIKERITQAVTATEGPAFKLLSTWLQMPTDRDFTKAMDVICKVRAENVGALLSPDGGKAHHPSSLATPIGVAERWSGIDKKLNAGYAVVIEGCSDHVCGKASYFINTLGTGFHALVFLAVGTDARNRFYLGFDPDISATQEARAKWLEHAKSAQDQALDTDESARIIKAMILGEPPDVFGPLVRKYYVDTSKPFPKIVRG